MQKTIVFTFALVLVCVAASAQSLGEIARQNTAKKEADAGRTQPFAKTYTNTDLPEELSQLERIRRMPPTGHPVEGGTLDCNKFDAVVSAADAVLKLRNVTDPVRLAPRLLDIDAPLVALGSAVKRVRPDALGEHTLVLNYLAAVILYRASYEDAKTDADKGVETFTKARTMLDAANDVCR